MFLGSKGEMRVRGDRGSAWFDAQEVQEKEDLAMRLDAEAREREKRVFNDRMQLEERKAKLQAQIERKRSRMLQEHKLRMEDDMRTCLFLLNSSQPISLGMLIHTKGGGIRSCK